jgi:hypothetical protein
VADITARFRIDVSGVDAALARVAAATLAVQGTFAAANAALAPFQQAFGAIKDSLDLGGRLSDVSAQTGIAVGDLVVLRQAFDNAGVGADGVGPAINRMQKALAGVTEEGEPSNEALIRLGLTMGEIRSLSPAEQFARVASGLAAIEDPTERAATAMKIFGRKGGEMMALFRDSSAMSTASQQVGGLAAAMDANAAQFDFISDAFNAAGIKGQQFAAGVTAAIAPALQEMAVALNKTDLTGLGESVGTAAAAVIKLGQAMSQLVPQIMGVVAAIALYRTGFDAKVMTAMSTIGPAAMRAFTQVRIAIASVSFSSVSTGARTAFATVGAAARGAALAIKGALISTGVGALIVGIGMAIEAVIGKFQQMKDGIRALDQAGSETSKSVNAVAEAVRSVSNEGDKVALGEKIDSEIAAAKEAMAGLNESAENLSDSDRDALSEEYQRRINYLERMRSIMERIPPEVMAGRQAEKDRTAAIEESRLKATELNKELGKNKASLDQKIADDAFGQLSLADQRSTILGRTGHEDSTALQYEIEGLAQKRMSTGLSDDEVVRMSKLIEAREKLLGIERNLSNERKKSAEDAAKAEQQRAEYEQEAAREIARLRAAASGDTAAVQSIERDQRIEQEASRAESAGLSPEDARRAATAKVDAAAQAESAERGRQNDETRAAIDLELRLAEAKAAGNDEEARRLEWLQKYNGELQRLRDVMPEAEAQEMATRLANANSSVSVPVREKRTIERVTSTGDGAFVRKLTVDPMVAEQRRNNTLLSEIKGVLQVIARSSTETRSPASQPMIFGYA